MRIFIASKDERLKLAIQLYLGQEPGIVMAGMSDRLHGLLIQLEGCQPDVLLLDWELCQQPMMDLLSELHNLDSRPKIIVLSRDSQIKGTVLAAGADGFINKAYPPDKLLPILRNMRLSATTV